MPVNLRNAKSSWRGRRSGVNSAPIMAKELLRCAGSLLCIWALALSAAAQTPQQTAPAKAPQAPPLKVTTHLVQVNVIVQDKKGEPVTDLSKADFELTDQGKPQTISVFSEETTHVIAAAATPPPPNVFSNRIEQKAGVPTSVTVILVDALNTHFTDMGFARNQLVKFLQQLQPQDRIALYGLTDRLIVLHDFTSDASALLAAFDKTRNKETVQMSASDFDPSDTGDDVVDAFIDATNQHISDFYTINRVETTAWALGAIANHLAALPGRKNLIWLSGAFPFYIGFESMDPNSTNENRMFSEEVERAARALNDANVAVYPVDARGLIAVPAYSASTPNISAGRMARGRPIQSLSPKPQNFDTMNILADRTGGRAYYNSNDIKGSIRRAIDDSRVTYVLGYYPDHGQWDGKFHEIKLKVKRPGVQVHYRRGYFAFGDQPVPDQKKRDELIREAVNGPLDSTALGLSVQADAVDVPGAQRLKASITIDSKDIQFNLNGDRWDGSVDVFYAERDASGKVLVAENKAINMNLTQPTYNSVTKNGLRMQWDIGINGNAQTIRLIARDATTGALGSVTIPLAKLYPSMGKN